MTSRIDYANITLSFNCVHGLRGRQLGIKKSLKNFEEKRVKANLKIQNCKELVFKSDSDEIWDMDVQGPLVTTFEDLKRIKLWNHESGKCLWTFESSDNLKLRSLSNLKIVEDKIVFATSFRRLGAEDTTQIYLIDLETGIQTVIEDRSIEARTFFIFKKTIFASLSKGIVAKWNFEGKLIDYINFQKLSVFALNPYSQVLSFENHLIYILTDNDLNLNTVLICDVESGAEKLLNFSNANISSYYLDGSRLICSFRTFSYQGYRNPFDACIIDLKKGEIIYQYLLEDALLDSELAPANSIFSQFSSITSIVGNEKWLVLGHSLGKIVVVNKVEKIEFVLFGHLRSIDLLQLKGDLLISGIVERELNDEPEGELKYWDLKSKEQIGKTRKMSGLQNLSYVEGKLFAICGGSLICTDYLEGAL